MVGKHAYIGILFLTEKKKLINFLFHVLSTFPCVCKFSWIKDKVSTYWITLFFTFSLNNNILGIFGLMSFVQHLVHSFHCIGMMRRRQYDLQVELKNSKLIKTTCCSMNFYIGVIFFLKLVLMKANEDWPLPPPVTLYGTIDCNLEFLNPCTDIKLLLTISGFILSFFSLVLFMSLLTRLPLIISYDWAMS